MPLAEIDHSINNDQIRLVDLEFILTHVRSCHYIVNAEITNLRNMTLNKLTLTFRDSELKSGFVRSTRDR